LIKWLILLRPIKVKDAEDEVLEEDLVEVEVMVVVEVEVMVVVEVVVKDVVEVMVVVEVVVEAVVEEKMMEMEYGHLLQNLVVL